MLASTSKNAVTASLRSFVRGESSAACRIAGPSRLRWASTAASRQSSPSQYVYEHERSKHNDGHSGGDGAERFRVIRGIHLSELNLQMRESMNQGHTKRVLRIASHMKENNIKPDIETYTNLLMAFAYERAGVAAWATLKDMQAMGIQPDVSCFNQTLRAFRSSDSDKFHSVLQEMANLGLQPNRQTYEIVIEYYAEGRNVEMALSKLEEMDTIGLAPSLNSVKVVAESLADGGHIQLALDIVEAYVSKSGRRLPDETWVRLLVASAENLNAEGVLLAWDKVVKEHRIVPDEGLCEKVLETAGRFGLPTLSSEVFQQLEIIGVQYQEHHFVPMIDAFVRNHQLKEAFQVLDLMRQAKVVPTLDSLESVREVIQRDPDLMDNAYRILEEMHESGITIDISTLNVLIVCTNWSRDLQRAIGIYKSMSSLGLKPNVETYESLLLVCRNAGHFELAERLFSEMREAGLKPTAKCFDLLVISVLKQPDYENAFFFLETMKDEGHKPAAIVYEHIIKKCVQTGDTRYRLAVDEMKQQGYKVSQYLKDFIANGGARGEAKDGREDVYE